MGDAFIIACGATLASLFALCVGFILYAAGCGLVEYCADFMYARALARDNRKRARLRTEAAQLARFRRGSPAGQWR